MNTCRKYEDLCLLKRVEHIVFTTTVMVCIYTIGFSQNKLNENIKSNKNETSRSVGCGL